MRSVQPRSNSTAADPGFRRGGGGGGGGCCRFLARYEKWGGVIAYRGSGI